MNLDHQLQREILLKLIHNPSLSFNQLWAKQGNSNKFAYHLKRLEETGLIQKNKTRYKLTDEGRKLSAFIEGSSGHKAEMPTLAHVLIVKKGNKMLCQKRLKEPFYGYWGFISGKINFGLNIFECAKRDLEEEAGLKAKNIIIKGIEQVKTYEKDKLIFHHYMIMLEATNIRGKLKKKTNKAKHAWLTHDQFRKKEHFPEVWLPIYFKNNNFTILEAERYMKNGKFTGCKLIKEISF